MQTFLSGHWVTDGQGVVDSPLEKDYYCGFETDGDFNSKEQLLANGNAVWRVSPLGCQGNGCSTRKYDNLFTIASGAGGDVDSSGALDSGDFKCLYFPEDVADQYTHPRMTPKAPTPNGLWLGNNQFCGLNTALYLDESGEAMDGESALIANKQAVFRLTPI
jgi:hypothetical protein